MGIAFLVSVVCDPAEDDCGSKAYPVFVSLDKAKAEKVMAFLKESLDGREEWPELEEFELEATNTNNFALEYLKGLIL